MTSTTLTKVTVNSQGFADLRVADRLRNGSYIDSYSVTKAYERAVIGEDVYYEVDLAGSIHPEDFTDWQNTSRVLWFYLDPEFVTMNESNDALIDIAGESRLIGVADPDIWFRADGSEAVVSVQFHAASVISVTDLPRRFCLLEADDNE